MLTDMFLHEQVHTDGFITLENVGADTDGEVLLAPFMSDLDTELSGDIFFREHKDNATIARANTDVREAFIETAGDFNAGSVFVVTWDKVQSASREDGVSVVVIQCTVVIKFKGDILTWLMLPDNSTVFWLASSEVSFALE